MESGGSDLLDFIGGMAAYNDGRSECGRDGVRYCSLS